MYAKHRDALQCEEQCHKNIHEHDESKISETMNFKVRTPKAKLQCYNKFP